MQIPILSALFGKKQQAGPAVRRAHFPAQHAWVMRIDDVFFHVISLIFSGGSAYAIWQIFTLHHAGDIGASIKGGVLSVAFGMCGYFLSRYIAYRFMVGESVLLYVPVCLVVEFVEIYCNYVVGISDLGLDAFLQDIPADQHALLILLGRIVVSCIPAMTLFLAVAHMDLQKRRIEDANGQPVQPNAASYGAGYAGNTAGAWQGNTTWQPNPAGGGAAGSRQRQRQQYANAGANGANPTPGVAP
jgi:hypothetical protein